MTAAPRLPGSESPLDLLCFPGGLRLYQSQPTLVKTGRSKAGAALCNQGQVDITSGPWGLHTTRLQLASGVTGARDELARGF